MVRRLGFECQDAPVRSRRYPWLPDRLRTAARAIRGKARAIVVYPSLRRSPKRLAHFLFVDREFDNFNYDIANREELATFLPEVLGISPDAAARFVAELDGDVELARLLGARLAVRRDRNDSQPYGRRLGWYVAVRARKPALAVETGVHDGLGSTVLLRALERNEAEGHPGRLLSFDVLAEAGWLVPDVLRSRYELVIGDALSELPGRLVGRRVDLFLHDSDHRYEHETAELELVWPQRAAGAVLISDNAHGVPAFRDFCDRHGLAYQFWREVPRDHFYPGAGIGMTVAP
jgi:hypothetical protein